MLINLFHELTFFAQHGMATLLTANFSRTN